MNVSKAFDSSDRSVAVADSGHGPRPPGRDLHTKIAETEFDDSDAVGGRPGMTMKFSCGSVWKRKTPKLGALAVPPVRYRETDPTAATCTVSGRIADLLPGYRGARPHANPNVRNLCVAPAFSVCADVGSSGSVSRSCKPKATLGWDPLRKIPDMVQSACDVVNPAPACIKECEAWNTSECREQLVE